MLNRKKYGNPDPEWGKQVLTKYGSAAIFFFVFAANV
jgi:hypothetical protein